MRNALIFGATGLTGHALLSRLLADERYGRIRAVVRDPAGLPEHPKLEKHISDFLSPASFGVDGSFQEVYCCIGTTIAKAGSREAFLKVDLEIPVSIAKAAALAGIGSMAVISSLGADANSSNFYLRTKGEMEIRVKSAYQGKLYFLRPSLLLGRRKEFRFGERMAQLILPGLNFLMIGKWKRYKAVQADDVAAAMIRVLQQGRDEKVIESERIPELARNLQV